MMTVKKELANGLGDMALLCMTPESLEAIAQTDREGRDVYIAGYRRFHMGISGRIGLLLLRDSLFDGGPLDGVYGRIDMAWAREYSAQLASMRNIIDDSELSRYITMIAKRRNRSIEPLVHASPGLDVRVGTRDAAGKDELVIIRNERQVSTIARTNAAWRRAA